MCEERNLKSKFQTLCGLLVWIAVLIFMAATAAGDVQQGQTEAELEGGEVVFEAGESASEAKIIQSITFKKDMKIRDALRFLATKYQKNIVPSASVDGMITVTSLYNVTFDEALKSILGYGFKYEQEGNFIKVYSAEEFKKMKEDPARMITKVFTLYYVSAAETAKLIAPVLSSVGTIQGSSPAKTELPAGESIGTGIMGGDAMALNDTIVIRDYPEKVAEAEALLKDLDVRPRQVLVEATILSATLDEDTQFGINWNTIGGVAISSISAIATAGEGGAETTGFAEPGDGGLRIGVTRGNVVALITALEEITDTTVLANPKILAVNKQLGQVYIGTKLGYRESDIVASSGAVQEGQVKFLDTGTKLVFRPYIGNDGYIRMDIHPKDSFGSLNVEGVPNETSTELATNIMVKDGETIVIGGLFRDVVTSTRNQIPILGEIPLIGFLFRGTSDETQREEVIVMLTPHIVKEPSETEGEAAAEDIARKGYGARMGLQWISVRRLAEERYTKAMKLYQDGDNETALYELGWSLALRPTYLEALRLQERIVNDVAPDELSKTEQIMLGLIQQEKGM
jgi:type II secretory pathway component GspD/PulD (secretin)